ncbi:MAG TPA: META domain-containing protein [Wenzhouxiangella sp.]|nr:META domain-containing protein [Wenzhouxiangella sp.]
MNKLRVNKSLAAIPMAALLLSACTFNLRPQAGDEPADGEQEKVTTAVAGQLFYPERIALPAEAVLQVHINEITPQGATVIADYRQALDGGQVPFPLGLSFERVLGDSVVHELRARVDAPEGPLRDSGPVLLDPQSTRIDLGRVRLFAFDEGLVAGNGPTVELPIEARGNEPGWRLRLSDNRAELDYDYGESRLEAPLIDRERLAQGERIRAAGDDGVMTATFHKTLCSDSATGMPHPWRVTAQVPGKRLTGCGGVPESLLVGDWVIEQVGELRPDENTLMTLAFDGEGRVGGSGACNSWFADYKLTPERLNIERPGATLMACADELMALDQRLFKLLANTRRFELDHDGRLLLISGDERIRARPADAD